ncbi:unnamed protein product [Closterium sp. NIES-65]|nr:unnamed protein product [Closterium sp. NIES-65]
MATARERIRLVLGRLVAAALRRSGIICAVSVTAGLVLLLLLPALSAPTYVDENALMPGSASPRYSESDARYAIALLQSLHTHRGSFDEWIAHHLRALQLPLYPHVWSPSSSRLTRTHLSTHPSDDDGDGGDGAGGGGQGGEGIDEAVEQEQVQAAESIATVLRSRQGYSDEAFVLVTPFTRLRTSSSSSSSSSGGGSEGVSPCVSPSDALSVAVALSLLRLLSQAQWQAKDVVMMIAAVTLQASPDWLGGPVDSLEIRADGINGQMPNLDLPATVQKISSWLSLKLSIQPPPDLPPPLLHLLPSSTLDLLSTAVSRTAETLTTVGAWLESVGVKGVVTGGREFEEGARGLARVLWNQLVGGASGTHGAFREVQVDAVSLTVLPQGYLGGRGAGQGTAGGGVGGMGAVRAGTGKGERKGKVGGKGKGKGEGKGKGKVKGKGKRPELRVNLQADMSSYVHLGMLLESVIRCFNNLSERLHHSHYYYLLLSPTRFKAADTAAAVQAAALVCLLFLWAALVATIPPHLQHLSDNLLSSPNPLPFAQLLSSLLPMLPPSPLLSLPSLPSFLLPSFLLPTSPTHCLLLWTTTTLSSLAIVVSLWWSIICPSVARTVCSLISTPSPHLTAACSAQHHLAPPPTAANPSSSSSCSSSSSSPLLTSSHLSSSPPTISQSAFWQMVRALSLGIVGVTIVSASCSNFAVASLSAALLFLLCSLISTRPSSLLTPPTCIPHIQPMENTRTCTYTPSAAAAPNQMWLSGQSLAVALSVAAVAAVAASVAAVMSGAHSRYPVGGSAAEGTGAGLGEVWELVSAEGFWWWVVESAVQGSALYGMVFRILLPVLVIGIVNLLARMQSVLSPS